MSDFFRFPPTPHLLWLGGGEPRDDKVLTRGDAEAFLAHVVVLEEKIDGANLGFSLGGGGEILAQNRGQYLPRPFTGQFSRLNAWLAIHEAALAEAVGESLMLFGEWVAAVHSLEYTHLPDYFLAFDVYDRSAQRFWSTTRRDALAEQYGWSTVPNLATGYFQPEALRIFLEGSSRYRDGACEGIYLRREDAEWLIARTKLVRPDFVQNMGEHWRTQALRWNVLDSPIFIDR